MNEWMKVQFGASSFQCIGTQAKFELSWVCIFVLFCSLICPHFLFLFPSLTGHTEKSQLYKAQLLSLFLWWESAQLNWSPVEQLEKKAKVLLAPFERQYWLSMISRCFCRTTNRKSEFSYTTQKRAVFLTAPTTTTTTCKLSISRRRISTSVSA